MGQGRARRHRVQRSVGLPAVILLPRHLASVGAQILAADVMELADLRAAHPREK